jgi:hypothetical protein
MSQHPKKKKKKMIVKSFIGFSKSVYLWRGQQKEQYSFYSCCT